MKDSEKNNSIKKVIVFFLIVLSLVILPYFLSSYRISFFITIFMYVVLAYSWNFISGYTGYVSFGQIVFFGLGAYAFAILTSNFGMNWGLAVVLAAIISSLFAVPIGLVMLRLKGPYFAVGMMGLSQFLAAIAFNWKSLTNGAVGIYLPPVFSLSTIYYAFLGAMIAIFLLTWKLENSNFGLRIKTIKEDEEGAEAIGINTTFYKVFAFTISACFCGIAGALQIYYLSYIDPYVAINMSLNLMMIAMSLVGGMGTMWGPLVGALMLGQLSEFLWVSFPYIYMIIFGCIIVVIIAFLPSGIVGYVTQYTQYRKDRMNNLIKN